MGKIFSWDARLGTYQDSISKTEGTPTNISFSNTGKGWTTYLTTTSSLAFTGLSFDLIDLITWVKGQGTLRISIGTTNNDIILSNDLWQFEKDTFSLTGETSITISVTSGYAYVAKVEGYDISLTTEQENDLHKQFQNSYSYQEVNKPFYEDLKPTDLSEEDGLVASYNMVPVNGQVIDTSVNGNDGNIFGTYQSYDGILFNTANDIIVVSDDSTLSIGSTASWLMNFEEYSQGVNKRIFSKIQSGVSGLELYANNKSITLRTAGSSGNSDYAFSTVNIEVGQNIDLALIKNGDDFSLYINGVFIETHTIPDTWVDPAGRDLNIGSSALGDIFGFRGIISDFRQYNRELSLEEIKDYHNSFAEQVYVRDDFSDEPIDSEEFLHWQVGSGSFKTGETIISESLGTSPFINSGASGTTDWVDTNTDGLADNWTALQAGIYSIVTGNGFTGNAQRGQVTGTNRADIESDFISVKSGTSYTVRFKYRGFSSVFGPVVYVSSQSGVTNYFISILPNNTGNAVSYESASFTVTDSTSVVRFFSNNNSQDGDWFEVDEVELYGTVYTEVSIPPEVDVSNFTSSYKYIECVTPGSISVQSTDAYGDLEFDLYKGADIGAYIVKFISQDKVGNSNIYDFTIRGAEQIRLRRDTTTLFETVTGYVEFGIWYRIKITHSLNGEFYVYIKGGDFGELWTLVDTTGGSGTNPVTDNTYTTSQYFVLDIDSGDRFRALKKKGLNSYDQNNILSAYFNLTM